MLRVTKPMIELAHQAERTTPLVMMLQRQRQVQRHLVIFDLDETFFSRYVSGIGVPPMSHELIAHRAPCSNRQQYYWINKKAWQVVLPPILTRHDVAILTSSLCHEPNQIKEALNTLLSPVQKDLGVDFAPVEFYAGNDFGDRHTKKGEKIAALRNTGVFYGYPYRRMVLVDDNLDHIESAQALGVKTVRAGERGYFHQLERMLHLGVELPHYEAYELGWDPQTASVTINIDKGDGPSRIRLR